MKTKKEIKNWILKNCIDKNGDVDLSYLDFENINIILSHIKAKSIYNENQEAKNEIYNKKQKAQQINNWSQETKNEIDNSYQKSKEIDNSFQKVKIVIDNTNQKGKFYW